MWNIDVYGPIFKKLSIFDKMVFWLFYEESFNNIRDKVRSENTEQRIIKTTAVFLFKYYLHDAFGSVVKP